MRHVRALFPASLLLLAAVAAGCAYELPTAPIAQATVARVPARIAIQVLKLEGYSDIRADVFTSDNLTVPSMPVQFATTAGTLVTANAMTDTVGVAYTRVTGSADATVTVTAGLITTTAAITRGAAGFSVSLNVGPQSPRRGETASLNAFASQAIAPATYTWSFGDGATEATTTNSVQHRYLNEGTLIATVTVLDAVSNAGSATVTLRVIDPPAGPSDPPSTTPPPGDPVLGITLSCTPKPAGTPTSCNVDASWKGAVLPSQAITRVTWDWGDGQGVLTPPLPPAAAHTYVLPGTYTVFATVTANTSDGPQTSARTSRPILVP